MNSYSAKAPTDYLDYACDFGPWLAQMPGDTPASVSVTVHPAGTLTVAVEPTPDPHPVAWLSGGTSGQEYRIEWHMVTTGGRIKTQAVALVVA